MRTYYYRTTVIILSSILILPALLRAQIAEDDIISVTESITYDYFFKHLKYLASDELKGRGVGTPEYDIAASYVANVFKNNGLAPFGDSGTYFQHIPLIKSSIQNGSFALQVEKGLSFITAEYGAEVSVVLNPKDGYIDENQKMVFVGYGNVVPDKNINDYAGVDVTGKTVIVALGGPKGVEHPDFNNRNAKFKNAVANGASGLILFYPKAGLLQNVIFNRVHGFLSKAMLSIADSSIESFIDIEELKLLLFAKKGFVKKVFKLNGLNFKKTLRGMAKGKHRSLTLSTTINCSYDLTHDSLNSKNVVALLPGKDARLKDEYVVLGAHLDGFGIGEPVKKDSIYNGMMDNASGVSALLSISKVFHEFDITTKRSIVFVCFTAEENGLLGSSYFANKNKIRNGEMVANLNIDMLARSIETIDMAPLGYSHSNLSEAADFAAEISGMKIDDNQKAEAAYIERSDQISFIKKGVPALFIAGGFTALNPKKNGEKVFNKWLKKRYHSPFDDLGQPFSENAFLAAVKFNFLTTYYTADVLEQIIWNEEGWLFKKYGLQK